MGAQQTLVYGGQVAAPLVNMVSDIVEATGAGQGAAASIWLKPDGKIYENVTIGGGAGVDTEIGTWLLSGALADYEVYCDPLTNGNLLDTLGTSQTGRWVALAPNGAKWTATLPVGQTARKEVELLISIRKVGTTRALASGTIWLIAEDTAAPQQLLDHTILGGPIGLAGLNSPCLAMVRLRPDGTTQASYSNPATGNAPVQALENWQRAAGDITHVIPRILSQTRGDGILSFAGMMENSPNVLSQQREILFQFPSYLPPAGKVETAQIQLWFAAGTVLVYKSVITLVIDQGATAGSVT